MNNKAIKNRISKIIITIILVVGSFVSLFPLLWMIRSSFMSIAEIFMIPMKWLPEKWLFSNYVEAFRAVDFAIFYKNSFIICSTALIAGTLTASLCAYSFARLEWKGKKIVFSCIMASMMLPHTVTMIPLFMQWNAIGFNNTWIPLIAPAFFGGGATYIFMMRQFYLSIPRALDDSAKIDGASHLMIFLKIMLPLTKPAMVVIAVFIFMMSWNDFMGPLIYLNDASKYTVALGLHMYKGQYQTEWNYLMAAATIAVIPVIVLFLCGQKYFVEGIILSGIKG
jgi:multiple sugar transport system permease protein